MKIFPLALSTTLFFVLTACGGGSSGGTPSSPPTAPTPSPIPSSSTTAKLDGIELGQVSLFSTSDPSLTLVAQRDAFVRVKAFEFSSTLPVLKIQGKNAAGAELGSIALSPPSQPSATKPAAFTMAQSYSATLPKTWVEPGLELTLNLNGLGQDLRITPKVSMKKEITLVAIPFQVADATASPPEGIGAHLFSRFPVSSIATQIRAPYPSSSVATLPATEAEWQTAFGHLLNEIEGLRRVEQPNSSVFYYGFVPKTTYGLAGVSWLEGRSGIGFSPNSDSAAKESMVHELGHNMSLLHAPCGNPSADSIDPQYPYANGLLGAGARFVWGFDSLLKLLIDPTHTWRHDPMSYCEGDWFSDYHVLKLNAYLEEGLPTAVQTPAASAQAVQRIAPQPVLLVSGSVSNRQIHLNPTTAFQGVPDDLGTGEYTLVIIANGKSTRHFFDTKKLTHDVGILFSVAVPHPGNIEAMEIQRAGETLWRTAIPVQKTTSKVLGKESLPATLNMSPTALTLTWNVSKWPLASLVEIDGNQRTALGLQRRGGEATFKRKLAEVTYEVSLSDGLNVQLFMFDAKGQVISSTP